MRLTHALVLLCLLSTAAPASAQYCASGGAVVCPNPFGGFISNVTIGSLNNSSACVPAPGYEDYTALPGPTLPRLVATPITVTVTGSVATNTVRVFCDWNQDFLFGSVAAGETFLLAASGSGVFTGAITPPSGAVASTRMRVRLHWNPSAASGCGAFTEGNTEDYTVNTTASLTGVPAAISAAAGGAHSLSLDAGSTHASRTYVLAGSMTGTSPGVMVGGLLVPLNLDVYTNLMLANANVPPFVNTIGTLDAFGRATATITIPPGLPLAGLLLHHAFVVLDGSSSFVFASAPAALTIVP